MSDDLRKAREVLDTARLHANDIEPATERVDRLMAISRQYQDITHVETYERTREGGDAERELAEINDTLRAAGFEYPTGARGVVDVCRQLQELRADFGDAVEGGVQARLTQLRTVMGVDPSGNGAMVGYAYGETVTDRARLRWDAAYQDAGGKHGSHWRMVAVQRDTNDVIMRDWYPGLREYGVMIKTWGDLERDHGPITYSHEMNELS